MAAYFNLNNNEISKELLVNQSNMILDNQGRRVLNDQKISSPQMNQPPEAAGKGILKNFANFTGKHLCRSLLQACNFIKRDSNTGVFL